MRTNGDQFCAPLGCTGSTRQYICLQSPRILFFLFASLQLVLVVEAVNTFYSQQGYRIASRANGVCMR